MIITKEKGRIIIDGRNEIVICMGKYFIEYETPQPKITLKNFTFVNFRYKYQSKFLLWLLKYLIRDRGSKNNPIMIKENKDV